VIRLKLETISGTKFDDDVYEVQLPTMAGQIGVLPGHMPLISVATHGVIKIRRKSTDPDDFMELFATNGGVIEVSDNVLSVLVDEADDAEEINEEEAKKAYELAQKMKAEAKDQVSLEHAQSLMDRHAVRLQVAGLKRRRRR
jgi:F-type H+-transporting ATPase subunit epsilon